MASVTSSETRRAALERLLQSKTFARAQNLRALLIYLVESELAGSSHLITEQSIGIEALNRRPDFNPKEDTIVRVEVHHLRKRLKRYYEEEGAEDPVQISLPAKGYRVEFIENVPEPTQPADPVLSPAIPQQRRRAHWWPWVAIAATICAALALVWMLTRNRVATDTQAPIIASDGAIRILAGAGRATYVDKSGRTWVPERFEHGGNTLSRPATVAGTRDQAIYQVARTGAFRYDIPLEPGTYELHLYCAETGEYGTGGRVMDIYINGQLAINRMDVLVDAGGRNIATERVITGLSPAKDGQLHVQFVPRGDGAQSLLNALQILPGLPDGMRPVRLIAQNAEYQDAEGRIWDRDDYAQGGQLATRQVPISGAVDPALYKGERYGRFTYSIPVAAGAKYRVTLYFSEMWFGAHNPAHEAGAQRIFNVFCNGRMLLENLNILAEAGENHAVAKVFHNVEPSPQAKLNLTFEPVKNYATVNAIEVLPEPR